ncbi:MAG TPA: NADH-dependent alcohol dehydrogenase, partial [Paenisporosarcina sp.]|nr:NADH-dependent alcohol dehydrogenase [Paenisporosarcina sp.]
VEPEGKTVEEIANEGIDNLRAYWTSLGAPETLADYDIDDSNIDVMVGKAMVYGPFGNFVSLESEDVRSILKASL